MRTIENWQRDAPPDDDATATLTVARARAVVAQAREHELKLAERQGRVISRQVIRAKWESLAIFFRETVLGVAGKISDACWSAQSREEVFVIIDTEMRELLATSSTGGDFDDGDGGDGGGGEGLPPHEQQQRLGPRGQVVRA